MNHSLRIAIVLNPFTLRRKGGDHAPSIATELLGRGHAVRVFGDVGGAVPQSRPVEGEEPGVAPLDGPTLKAFAPDVIVAYDGLSPAAWRGARAAARLGVPLVLVEEGFPDHGKPVERLLRGFGARAWGRLVRRQARRVVALDPVAAAQAEQEGFRPAIIDELPSGVDTATYRPGLQSALLARPSIGAQVLLFVGRIEPGRGVELLVDAFARTVGQHNDWALVFAGTGTLRSAIRAQVERLGISARVHWLGVPRDAELPGLFASSTALLVPALDDDVASHKLRRAMACGVPVLVSDVARLRGTVEHEVSGLVVPAGERDAWVRAIGRLASDPNRRARWGRSAREAALDRMSWERVAERFEEILLELVAPAEVANGTVANGMVAAGPSATPTGCSPRGAECEASDGSHDSPGGRSGVQAAC